MGIEISVVIPTYKEEKYIATTLNALQVQTAWNNLEIVVADYDPDGTQKTIESISKGCSKLVKDKVKIVKVNKNGIGYARHFGINEADGRVIVNFDSDSFFANKDDIDNMASNVGKQVYNPITNEMTDIKVSHCSVQIQPSELYNIEATKFNLLYSLRNALLSMSRLPVCYEQGMTLSKKTYWDAGGFKDVREGEGPLLCATIAMMYGAFSLVFEPRVTVLTSARRGVGSDGFLFDANYSHAFR